MGGVELPCQCSPLVKENYNGQDYLAYDRVAFICSNVPNRQWTGLTNP